MSPTEEIQKVARELLAGGQVSCVIGYEVGPRGRTRPAFIYQPEDAGRLVWNQQCTHNLTVYLRHKLRSRGGQVPQPVAVVVKPCDSRAVNVLLAENQIARQQVYLIGLACPGIRQGAADDAPLQARCLRCDMRTPVVYDVLIGEPAPPQPAEPDGELERLAAMTPAERMDFWLSQFDRCIRCYACRQACPLCNCPTCLYERDDSLWVGMGIRLGEKRAFHLGRAYHLAGRCIGCDECERVCPMNIPISLLNRALAREVEAAFGYRPGLEAQPSPITTMLSGEER